MAGWLKDWASGTKVVENYSPYPSGYGGYPVSYPSNYGNFNTTPYNTGNAYGYGSSYTMPIQSYPMPTQSYVASTPMPQYQSMPMPQYQQPQYQTRVINVPSTRSVQVPKHFNENVTQTYTVPKMETKTRTVRVPVTKYHPLNPQPCRPPSPSPASASPPAASDPPVPLSPLNATH